MKELDPGHGESVKGIVKSYVARATGHFETHRGAAWATAVVGIAGGSSAIGVLGLAGVVVAIPLMAIGLLAGWVVTATKGRLWRVGLGLFTAWCVSVHNLTNLLASAFEIGLLVAAVAGVIWYRKDHTTTFKKVVSANKLRFPPAAPFKRGLNSHFTAAGNPKRAYRFEYEAQDEAEKLTRMDGAAMSTYQCAECSQWHVGHAKTK